MQLTPRDRGNHLALLADLREIGENEAADYVAQRWFDYLDNGCNDAIDDFCPSHMLEASFIWALTPQGEAYWRNINNELLTHEDDEDES